MNGRERVVLGAAVGQSCHRAETEDKDNCGSCCPAEWRGGGGTSNGGGAGKERAIQTGKQSGGANRKRQRMSGRERVREVAPSLWTTLITPWD